MFNSITPFFIQNFDLVDRHTPPFLDLTHPEIGRRSDMVQGLLPLENGLGKVDTASQGIYSEYFVTKPKITKISLESLTRSKVNSMGRQPSTVELRQIKDGCRKELTKVANLQSKKIPILAFPRQQLLLVGTKITGKALDAARLWMGYFASGNICPAPHPESILFQWAEHEYLPDNTGLGELVELQLKDGSVSLLMGSQVKAGLLTEQLNQCQQISKLALRFHEGWEWVITPTFVIEKIRKLEHGKKAINDLHQETPKEAWAIAERDYHSNLQWENWGKMLSVLKQFTERTAGAARSA